MGRERHDRLSRRASPQKDGFGKRDEASGRVQLGVSAGKSTLVMLWRFVPALERFDPDLLEAFQQKLRVRWTHSSTALEGNTLDEGETFGVLQYGLTITGKPLGHHNEVLGHSRALDLLCGWILERRQFTVSALFELHRAVQAAVEADHFRPVGAWKRESNSTLAKVGGQAVINDTYASPEHVEGLMEAWFREFERLRTDAAVSALDAYVWSHATFARIHPFTDGNGRMARLLANVPVLQKGELPILIPVEKRLAYVESLATWQMASGKILPGGDLSGDPSALEAFGLLCREAYDASQAMIEEAVQIQAQRGIRSLESSAKRGHQPS
ncbi:MAG: hypothetical protein RLZZ399_678 [Verrucomicrobiota bacterium]